MSDSLAAHPGQYFDMVLTNPPFGKKSSVTFVTDEGEIRREVQMGTVFARKRKGGWFQRGTAVYSWDILSQSFSMSQAYIDFL